MLQRKVSLRSFAQKKLNLHPRVRIVLPKIDRYLAAALFCSLLTMHGLRAEEPAEAKEPPTSAVSFANDVKPIFSQHCYGCHQGAKQLGSYLMTDFKSLLKGGETEQTAVVPGKPDDSYLLRQIIPVDGHAEMPDEPFSPLNDVEIETIRNWILQGAQNDSIADDGPKYTTDNPPTYIGQPSLASIDVSPDGSKIAAAGFHEVIILDAESGKRVARLVGMSPRINTVRFSPDGKRLAAVGGTPAVRGEVQVWDLETNELSLSRSVTYDSLCGASWSPDGSKLAFGATDNVVRAIDAISGEQILFQGAHDDWVRDTAFTPDGKHVISVARDMSCKLTEVETERFIDNITSITPGALSGGLSSVKAHPERNEIFVGGADGIAKVYRVFRQTARKIGDDANLVRKFPELPGRISSVDINPSATRLAAAATLDGKSEIRVWKYDFSSEISPELKKIQAKRVADRNAEEKKQLENHLNSKITELNKFSIDNAAVFAIAFGNDDTLVIAAADGKIRRLDAEGKLIGTFEVAEVADDAKLATSLFDAKAWQKELESQIKATAASADANVNDTALEVAKVLISPAQIDMDSPYAYAQLVVTAIMSDNTTRDITRVADITIPDWATITPRGVVRAASNGQGSIAISYGGITSEINLIAQGITPETADAADHGAVDYIRDVGPILSRLGCNQGTCHGAQKGKNGFKLSLRGYDPIYDLRALTDDLAARRINAASPDESLMLRKPLGLSPHQGGVLMAEGDPYHTVLERWIADGSQLNLESPRVSRIEIFPTNPVVQRTDAKQQVRVIAHYQNGDQRDVTQEAFIESGNTETASVDKKGLLSAIRRGEAAILARYEGAYAATTLTVMGKRDGYKAVEVEQWSNIDKLVADKWQRVKVIPSEICDDSTFLRRVHLDLTGLPPSSEQVRKFLADETPIREKRAGIIDELIGSDAYVDYWTNKWADLLQVNRKFLGVEGSTKFREWIRTAIAENRPYNVFAEQVLTATGSNNDNPPASYFKVLRTPDNTMENTTHLFLGIRFNCNKCHDHPFERWTQDQYYQLSAFFAQVGLENDPASGKRKIGGTAVEGAKPLFEKVVDRSQGDVKHPKTNSVVAPKFPFDIEHDTKPESTRRQQLAAWITHRDNPYFARSYVNRLWGYLLGVGLIEPIDDIRAGNPASNPELLDYLTDSFVESGFNVAEMHRTICNSRTYQLSIKTNAFNEDDSVNYSHALPRRLPAEVIFDAVHTLTGAVSNIPGMPKGTRATAITDSGVKLADGFLQNLGRPARESACECERSSDLQLGPVMALVSGPTVGSAIADPKNVLEKIVAEHPDDNDLAEEIFIRALARYPKPSELEAFAAMKDIIKESHEQLVAQLATAESNWKERRQVLEKEREAKLVKLNEQIVDRTNEIKPEREKLAKQRQDRIDAAKAALEKEKERISAKLEKMSTAQGMAIEWHPLTYQSGTSTNKAVLTPQPDRSIVASGDAAKTVYTVTMRTSLNNITGIRLEALSDPKLPSKGPGLADNGNFVVTELEVLSASSKTPEKSTKLKIASGRADFTQPSFNINQAFDGNTNDQKGWAISPAMGTFHWATFKFDKPLKAEGETILTFKIHQFHNAAKHMLGRFRLSATTAVGDIPLGVAEPLAAMLLTPKERRDEQTVASLNEYITKTDADIRKAQDAVAAAGAAVPPDAKLVALEQRKVKLSQPTSDDPQLVQLRDDAKQSAQQLERIRLTAAEDLTWALINSPAFLFNH
jgi:WD40 repeat protein